MLGTDLCQALRAAGCRVTAPDLPEFDITRADHVELALAGASAVVNCAAYTNVDGAETKRELAEAVNHVAVGTLGRLAAARGLYVLHISTDFVFDGELERPYRETDLPRPLSVYGASKLAGEQALGAAGGEHAIVRVQWTYGRGGQNFVSKFLARAAVTDELAMVADQVGRRPGPAMSRWPCWRCWSVAGRAFFITLPSATRAVSRWPRPFSSWAV